MASFSQREIADAAAQASLAPLSSGVRDASDAHTSSDLAVPHATKQTPWKGVGRIACFFALIAALTYGVDTLINSGFRRIRTSAFGVTNRIVEGRINADIVISGSSRALVHYDPRIIRAATGLSAYNIGRNGSQTDLQLAVLKTYLLHNARPKLIIHNLDLFSFATSHEIYDPAQYVPYLANEPIYSAVKRVYQHAWKWKHIPLYGYVVEDMRFTWVKGLKAAFGVQPLEDHILGFVPRHMKWTADFENFARDKTAGVTFEVEPQGVRDLRALVEICRQNAIPLLFVYAPEYRAMQAMVRNRSEIFSLFHSICEEYRVLLWDYSDSPLSDDQSNFYNSQHLNANGAAKFSQDIAGRLRIAGDISAPRSQ